MTTEPTSPSINRRPAPPDPGDQVVAYMRKAGLALLVGAMIVDVGWQQWETARMKWVATRFRLSRVVDPPGAILAQAAVSLLDSSPQNDRPKS